MVEGVEDTNVARNQIAKNYLKKSHRIWILAPITRAVDDKVAKGLFTLDLPLLRHSRTSRPAW